MITITKRIRLRKQVKNDLLRDEAKLIPGVVDKLNKRFQLVLLRPFLHLILIRLKSMLNHIVNLMVLKNRIQTRNSKIKKFARK
jgi:hypothetical protein